MSSPNSSIIAPLQITCLKKTKEELVWGKAAVLSKVLAGRDLEDAGQGRSRLSRLGAKKTCLDLKNSGKVVLNWCQVSK